MIKTACAHSLNLSEVREKRVRQILAALLIAFWWISSGLTTCKAQQNLQHTANNRDLGMRIDARIDPSTLGMSLVIPLANYPGRAGNSFPVALYYNSKVWRLNYDAYVNGNQENCVNNPIIEAGTECYTTTMPIYAEHSVAGWTFSGGFPTIATGDERYNVNGHACCSGDPNQGNYIARLTVRFPNGATHELRRSDAVHSGADPQIGTYYAVDSSRLKYVSTVAGTGKLYLPDGSFFEMENWAGTKLTDRNGNFVSSQTDTLGRQIVAPVFHNASAHSEIHSIPGVNGASMSYTFEMELLQDALEPDLITSVVPALHRLGDMDKFGNSVYSPSLFASESGSRVIGGGLTFNPVVLRSITLPNGSSYTFGYNQYGEITRVDYPTGGYERFSYGSIAPLAAIGSPYSQGNRGVLERRISATGSASDEVTWSYSSTGTEVTTIAPNGTRTVRYLLPSAPSSVVVFGLEDPRAGMIYEERVYKPAAQGGAMLRRSLTSWIVSGALSGGQATAKRNPRVDRQVDIILDTGGNALATATQMTYDADLNVTSTKRYDFVSLSPTTAQTAEIATISNGTLLRTQETDYLTNDADYRDRHLLVLPVETRLRNGAGTLVAKSVISYDEYDQEDFPLLTYGLVTGWQDPGTDVRGNATTVSTWLNTTNSFLSAHTQYDQCGSVRNVWDARDTNQTNPSSIEYSATYHRAYPTSSSSADPDLGGPLESLTSTTEYDLTTGLVTAQVDENGQRTTVSYNDPLNRLKQIVRAETVTALRTQTSYSYDDTARTITVTSDLSAFNDNALKSMTLFDGLGRAIEGRSYEGGTNYIVSKTQYDELGRAFKTSNPFRPWLDETAVWTTQAFDALGRVISVTTPDSAVVTTSYSGTSITVTDQAGKQRKSVTDALGRLVQVYEAPGVPGFDFLTQYTYDTLDNLTTVTQGSQTRTFVYDSLKRLTSAANPENGTISYQYDNNGNLLVKTDARNVSAHYEYDRLNRLTRRWYNGASSVANTTHNVPALPASVGASNESKFFYDSQALPQGAPVYTRGSSLGRLVAQTYGAGTNGDYFAYDALGRATLKIQQTGSVNYQTSAVYNRASAVTSMTYPSGRTITNSFDAAGRLTTFSGTLGDGTTRTYANEMIYSSLGALAKEKFGTTTPIYNKLFYNVRGQLAEVRASTSYTGPTDYDANRGAIVNNYSNECTGICSGSSMPDNNGNLLKQEIHIPNQTMRWQQYEYDSLNRLKSAREVVNGGAEQWKQQFNYDRWGNRTIETSVTYGIGINNKAFTVIPANNRLGVPAGQFGVMSYDNAGNLTNDSYTGAGERKYDAENKITSAKGSNNQDQLYQYDGSGQRIKRTVNGVETWQVHGLGGELLAEYPANGPDASPHKEYGYRNGQLLVTLDAPAPPPNGYAFRRAITIDHNKVSNAAQSNFPVLVSGTYSYLATTANGGNVQNANGYDVIFTSDSGCATKLNHEVETYTAATGAVNYWVKVPVLFQTTDTTIFLCYGNSSVTTDQSNKTAVWDANYKGIWHLPNGTSLNASDSTANGNNGIITGAVATAGRMDGGASLNGTSDHVQVKAGKVDTSATTGTVSAWVKLSALDKNGVVVGYGGAAATDPALWGVYIREVSGSYYFAMSSRKTNGGVYSTVRGNTALTAGTWYYVTYSTNGSAWKIRVNGATAQTLTVVLGTNTGDWIGDISATTPDKSDIGGIYAGGAYSNINFWNGVMDEVRLSNVERSDNWVATEYNNQSSPSTFYTISSATSLTAPSQVQWLVTDHLGTPRMILDQTGALANMKRHDYLPFGEELFAPAGGRTTAMAYANGDAVRQQFTGKERDVETGLDYFPARSYSGVQGRFTAIDPTMESISGTNPQSWNRYLYVFNNPLRYIDPFGLWAYSVVYEYYQDGEKKGQVKSAKLIFTMTSDKDDATSLLEQLGYNQGDKGFEKLLKQVQGALGEGNSVQSSKLGGEIGSFFAVIENKLRDQKEYDRRNPTANDGPYDAAYQDCSMTACRLAYPAQMRLRRTGINGNENFGVDEADEMTSKRPRVSLGALRIRDIIRYGQNETRHFANVIFTGDDGVAHIFSRSGVRGRFETLRINEPKLLKSYGPITGSFRP